MANMYKLAHLNRPIVTILLDFGNIVPEFTPSLFWLFCAMAVHDFLYEGFSNHAQQLVW